MGTWKSSCSNGAVISLLLSVYLME